MPFSGDAELYSRPLFGRSFLLTALSCHNTNGRFQDTGGGFVVDGFSLDGLLRQNGNLVISDLSKAAIDEIAIRCVAVSQAQFA